LNKKLVSEIGVVGNLEFDTSTDFVTINTNQSFVRNNYYLVNINYTGLINDLLVGFYRSSFIDSKGEVH
jgi:hypothetical protein